MKTKHITIFIVLASFTAILYGFFTKDANPAFAHKCIGAGTAALFLIAMPLFLFTVSKGKKVKDYMLSEENIRKMQGKEPFKNEQEE